MEICPNGYQPILVVGSDGTVGRGLVTVFEREGVSVWGSTRNKTRLTKRKVFLDLSLPIDESSLPLTRIKTAMLCAGVTSMADCHKEPGATRRINVVNTVNLAQRLVDAGVFVIFISSNAVFDGFAAYSRISEPTNPQTEYGHQKAEAEKVLLGLGDQVAVVRFSKILTPGFQLFKHWIRDLSIGKVIHPFSNVVLSPIPLGFALRVLKRVAVRRISGITQISAAQDISYDSIAQFIARKFGFDQSLVEPILFSNPVHSQPPLHTTLDITRLMGELDLSPPDVWNTIDKLVVSHREIDGGNHRYSAE